MRPAALPGRRRLAFRHLGPCIGGAALALLLGGPGSWAVPADGIDIPRPSRVERFNPDQQACQPQMIKAGFARQLQPWADQPPAVLEQLRRVQAEMTRASLQRCLSKGLLPAAEAAELERQLGLPTGGATADPPGSVPAAERPANP